MGARISWRDVAGLEGQLELGYTEIFIGRAVECAVRTDDPLVSRRHARIFFQNGAYLIEDLGSANGIYHGENRAQVHTLQNGDNIRAGNLWIRFTSDAPVFASPPSGPQMSPSGGTQLLQINEPFNPGSAAAAAPPMNTPSYGSGGFGAGPASFGGPPMAPMGMAGPAMGSMGPPPPLPPMVPVPSAPSAPPMMGSPPAAYPQPAMGSLGGPPPPVPGPPPPMGSSAVGAGGLDADEALRLQRRLDQATSELRMIRGGGDKAIRMDELEDKISRLERDNMRLLEANQRLERGAAQGGGDVGPRINVSLSRAEEVASGLNDVLSELRINVLAAEGEVEQWSRALPPASFELVRESLRSCRVQMELARDYMRMLRSGGRT